MKRETRINLILVIVLMILGPLGFKKLADMKKPPEKSDGQATQAVVRTISVLPENERVQMTLWGSIEARDRIVLKPEVSGKVASIHPAFEAGGFIQAGETLFQIEGHDYRIARNRAEASLQKSRAIQLQREEELKIQERAYQLEETSLRLAEAELKRYQEMFKEKTVSRNDVDTKEAAYRRLESQLMGSLSRLKTLPAQIEQAKADVSSAEAQLNEANLKFQRTSIKSPFPCRVVREDVTIGQYVQAGADVGEILNLENLELVAPVPAHEISWLYPHDDVAQGLPEAGNGVPAHTMQVQARVTPLAPDLGQSFEADLKRSASILEKNTRSLLLYFSIRSLAGGLSDSGLLLPGSFCRLELQGRELSNVYRVPRLSIRNNRVQIVRQGKIKWLPFTTIRDSGGEILGQADFELNDEVVRAAQDSLSSGVSVKTIQGAERA